MEGGGGRVVMRGRGRGSCGVGRRGGFWQRGVKRWAGGRGGGGRRGARGGGRGGGRRGGGGKGGGGFGNRGK